jgi:hypothetical protein
MLLKPPSYLERGCVFKCQLAAVATIARGLDAYGDEDPVIIYGRVQRKAVSLLTSSIRPPTQVARELGVQPPLLHHWRDDRQANGPVTGFVGSALRATCRRSMPKAGAWRRSGTGSDRTWWAGDGRAHQPGTHPQHSPGFGVSSDEPSPAPSRGPGCTICRNTCASWVAKPLGAYSAYPLAVEGFAA